MDIAKSNMLVMTIMPKVNGMVISAVVSKSVQGDEVIPVDVSVAVTARVNRKVTIDITI